MNINTGVNRNSGENYLDALTRSYDNTVGESDSLKQFTDRYNNGYRVGGSFSYTEPIGKKGQLQLNYRPSYSRSNADQQTWLYDFSGNKYSLFDTTLSNKFENDYITQNAGISYRLNGSKKNQFYSRNQAINTGVVVSSNVSEYVDFNFSYQVGFNNVNNSLQPGLDNKYFTQNAGLQLNLLSRNGWLFQNDLNNQAYRGLGDGFNQVFWLWNISLGKKFLKKQAGELKLSVFDLLNKIKA